jgi:hypothetical protein
MVANDWNLEALPNDLIVGNRYNYLTVDLSRERIHFEIRFRSVSREEFPEFLEKEDLLADRKGVFDSVKEWPVALCTIVGRFVWPSDVVISEYRVVGNKHRYLYEGNISGSGGGICIP